jgi:ABC-2 type transport system permease protein
MMTLLKKELVDYFTSVRFIILLVLTLLVTALALHAAYATIRTQDTSDFVFLNLFTCSEEALPQLLNLPTIIALFFMPFVGITLGFDAVNSERNNGTLSLLMAQPIYRDSIINAKFLASLFIVALTATISMLLISGIGLRMIGVPPSSEEFIRLFIYLISIIIYGAFWVGLSILFSVVFRWVGTSLMSALALWLFFGLFYIFMLAPMLANMISPLPDNATEAMQAANSLTSGTLLRLSPNYLFLEASTVLLLPLVRTLGVITTGAYNYMIPNPLSLGQSMLLVWPHLVVMISLTAVCFGVSYVMFMRQEIRS